MKQSSRDRLIRIIDEERKSPGAYSEVLKELETAFPDAAALMRFLVAKDDQHRHAFYLKSQHMWYRKVGWKIMRPLFVVAVIGAVLFSLQKVIDPTLGVAAFIAGAAAFYVAFQLFAHRWSNQELKKMEGVNARYRETLESLLKDLRELKR